MTPRVLTGFVVLAHLATASLAAQTSEGARSGVAHLASTAGASLRTDTIGGFDPIRRLPSWTAPIASAILPGVGQAHLGKARAVGYLAAEGYLWFQYISNIRLREENERNFRTIARDVARRSFPGTHPDTVWQYYEKMEKYMESGAYSMATSGATIPQTDLSTYNGEQWRKARLQFGIALDDPDPSRAPRYLQALEYYESLAITQPYGWSWNNAQLEKDLFNRSISRRNDASTRATNALIALGANHILSMIDAFAEFRLLQAAQGGIVASAVVRLR